MLLTVVFRQPGQAVVLLVCDEVGQASEQASAQLTFKDGVHFPQQHVFELSSSCKSMEITISIRVGIYQEACQPYKMLSEPRANGSEAQSSII